jgi:hypothetical protein
VRNTSKFIPTTINQAKIAHGVRHSAFKQFSDLETHFGDTKPGARQNNSSELDEPPALTAVTAIVLSCSTDSIGSFALTVAARYILGRTNIVTRAVRQSSRSTHAHSNRRRVDPVAAIRIAVPNVEIST